MATSNAEIWHRIISDGLLCQTQCHELQQKISQSIRRDQKQDGHLLLETLVELEAINGYQARILSGKSKGPLRDGQWLILGRPHGNVWKDWLQIRRMDITEDKNSQSISTEPNRRSKAGVKWGRWLNPSTVKSLGGTKALVSRWKKWSHLDTRMVQHSDKPTIENNRLLLQVHPVIGEPLSRCAADAVSNHEQILHCVRSLATTLATIHEQGMVYGSLKPDRIFWDQEKGLTIVFEPVSASAQIRYSNQVNSLSPIRLLHNDLENLAEDWFVAPELNRSEHSLDPTADVYSLGAIWWWLLNHKSPKESGFKPDYQHLESQNSGISQFHVKCLARCVAVNPEERFSDAIELSKTLESSRTSPTTGRTTGTIESIEATTRGAPRVARKRRTLRSFLPLIASCTFLFVALFAMIWSGVFSYSSRPDSSITTTSPDGSLEDSKRSLVGNPLEEHFQIVESQEYPWVPPSPPRPISLSGLPPGVQFIMVLHPSRLLQMPNSSTLLELFQDDQRLVKRLKVELDNAGVRFEDLRRLTLALYRPLTSDSITDGTQHPSDSFSSFQDSAIVLRLELETAYDSEHLKSLWNVQSQLSVDEHAVFPLENDRAIYLPPAGLTGESDAEPGVRLFCLGPTNLIKEAAELEGAEGPVNVHIRKLLERSNCDYDFSFLASPRFLFSEGKGAMQALPSQLQQLIEAAIGRESRALLVQSSIGENWYWEVQAIGARDSEAVELLKQWSDLAAQASAQAEALLLEGNPHVYWRALAVRFPQMLRAWNQSARFGIEDGVVVANGYLPSIASSNLVAAAWISLQENALPLHSREEDPQPSSDRSLPTSDSRVPRVEIEEYLNRPITLSFEQEPLERALELIGEEANGGSLPASQQFRFELDGAGFQKAGITRNQQISQFQIKNQSVRHALTELARRGNPASNISDTRDSKQQLVWVVVVDPTTQGGSVILLTTRTAAAERRIPLPMEFAVLSEPET